MKIASASHDCEVVLSISSRLLRQWAMLAGDTAEADAVRSADAGSEEGHESAPAGEADLEPGEQPLPKKRKLAGGAALAAEQVAAGSCHLCTISATA